MFQFLFLFFLLNLCVFFSVDNNDERCKNNNDLHFRSLSNGDVLMKLQETLSSLLITFNDKFYISSLKIGR